MSERTKKYLKDFKSKLSYTFLLSGGVSLIVLVIFALCGLFFFLTKDYGYSDLFSILILAIFLSAVVGLLSPFIYSYLANYVTLGSKDKELVSLKSLFKTSSFGFRPPYKGLLSSFINLLFAILCFLLLSTIFRSLFYSIFVSFDSSMQQVMNEVANLLSSNDLDGAINLLSANEDMFYLPEMLSTYVSLVIVLFFYLKSLLVNILKFCIILSFTKFYKRPFNQLFKITYKEHRKELNKGFYTYAWPIFVSFFVVFTATFMGLFFGFNLSHINSFGFLIFISLASIVFGFIVSLIFYPLLFNYYGDISKVFSLYLRTTLANALKVRAETEIERMKFTEENRDELENMINSANEEQERIKKEFDDINEKVDENIFYKTDEEKKDDKNDEENKDK